MGYKKRAFCNAVGRQGNKLHRARNEGQSSLDAHMRNDSPRQCNRHQRNKVRGKHDYCKGNSFSGPDFEKEREKVSRIKYLAICGDNCVVGNTKIICKSGEKNISEIETGEKVLTHKGQFRQVVKKFKRAFSGEIITLKTVGSNETIEITPEHPILAVRTKHCQYKSSRNHGKTTICSKACVRQKYASYNRECLYKHYANYKVEWIKAGELKKQDKKRRQMDFSLPRQI